jgi:hypothetical protein
MMMFNFLNHSRTSGMNGMNPISISEIGAMFHIVEANDVDERRFLLGLMKTMDHALLNHYHEKAEK